MGRGQDGEHSIMSLPRGAWVPAPLLKSLDKGVLAVGYTSLLGEEGVLSSGRLLVDSWPRKPTIPWAASKAAQPAGRGRGSAPLLCAVRPQLQCCIQMWSPQCRETWSCASASRVQPQTRTQGWNPSPVSKESWAVQPPGEVKAPREPGNSLSIPKGKNKGKWR